MSLDDMYHVERVLARGVGGVTELVTIEGSGPFVRKKIPLAEANRSVWSACADCGCKRLPQIEAMYELPDEFVMVYDFVPGDSVDWLVRTRGRVPVEQAISLARDLCEAVGALHARGVIHRDIAPTNVIVAHDGAHLIDLGIARMHEDGASHDGDALGTWGYASPEQYGFAQTDRRSDVYSIGRVLAYLACGVAPTDDGFDAVLADDAVVPPALRAVIEKATSFEPSARYQSTDELVAALAGVRAEGRREEPAMPSQGQPQKQVEPGARESSHAGHRHRALVVCAAVAAVAAVALLAVALRPTAGPANSNDSAPATANLSGESDGDVLTSGGLEWNVAPDGSVVFLVSLTNTSDALTVDVPSVTVTGTDAQGNVTFSREETFCTAYPGQTVSMADFVTGAGSTTDVTSSVNQPVTPPRQLPDDQRVTLEARNVTLSTDDLGNPTATGVVARGTGEGEGSRVRVDVVFRDAAGRLVGMGEDYPAMPAVGGTTSFQASDLQVPGKATSCEVYVNPWA